MTLPPLPEEFELNWFSKRNAFDIAVKEFIEDSGGGGGVSSWDDLEDKPAVIAAGASQAAARTEIDAAPSSHSHEAVQVSDSTSVGREVLTAANAAAARTAIDAQVAGSYLTSVPDATTSTKGAVELATTTEATAGTDTVRAVTPAGLKAALDARIVVDPISTSGLPNGTLIARTS